MNGFKLKPCYFPGVPVADSGLPIQGANLGLILDKGTKKKKKKKSHNEDLRSCVLQLRPGADK